MKATVFNARCEGGRLASTTRQDRVPAVSVLDRPLSVRLFATMTESPRLTPVMLRWLFLLVLLVLAVVIAFAPGWVSGFILAVVFLGLGYTGVALYYRRYQEFHKNDHE
jgi:hypothetical protein